MSPGLSRHVTRLLASDNPLERSKNIYNAVALTVACL